MTGTMPPIHRQNRRLRRHPDLADSSPKEIAADAASLPYLTLAAVLMRDESFMAAVATIRDQPQTLEAFAKRYVPKNGRGRRLIRQMLAAAAAEPDALHARARLGSLASWSVWADAEVDEGERVRWGRSNARYRTGAELVARRGAGICLAPSCPTAVLRRRLWCRVHAQRLAAEREADERSMRTVLDAAGRALGH
jgi:hypothetical protein